MTKLVRAGVIVVRANAWPNPGQWKLLRGQGLVVSVGASTAVLPSAALNKSRTYSLFSQRWRESRVAIHICPPHPSLLYFGDSLISG